MSRVITETETITPIESDGFCLMVEVKINENGRETSPPPYSFTMGVIKDILQRHSSIQIEDVRVISPSKTIVFVETDPGCLVDEGSVQQLAVDTAGITEWVGLSARLSPTLYTIGMANELIGGVDLVGRPPLIGASAASRPPLFKGTVSSLKKEIRDLKLRDRRSQRKQSNAPVGLLGSTPYSDSDGAYVSKRRPTPSAQHPSEQKGEARIAELQETLKAIQRHMPSSSTEDTSEWSSESTYDSEAFCSGMGEEPPTRATRAHTRRQANQKKRVAHFKIEIPKYSGDTNTKGDSKEVSYEAWRYDVTMFREDYSDSSLLPVVVRSLTGIPGDLARNEGKGLTLTELLGLLDRYYGVVEDVDALMQDLYTATQGKHESVVNFLSRIAAITTKIQRKHPTRLSSVARRKILVERLYGGIRGDLRRAIAYTQDSKTKYSYNELVEIVRRLENDFKVAKKGESSSKPVYSSGKYSTAHWKNKAAFSQSRSARVAESETETETAAASESEDSESAPEASGDEPNSSEDTPPPELDQWIQEECVARLNLAQAAPKLVTEFEEKIKRCFTCNDPGHFARECPKKDLLKRGSQQKGKVTQKPHQKSKSHPKKK